MEYIVLVHAKPGKQAIRITAPREMPILDIFYSQIVAIGRIAAYLGINGMQEQQVFGSSMDKRDTRPERKSDDGGCSFGRIEIAKSEHPPPFLPGGNLLEYPSLLFVASRSLSRVLGSEGG